MYVNILHGKQMQYIPCEKRATVKRVVYITKRLMVNLVCFYSVVGRRRGILRLLKDLLE